jgi:hypothetical protein
MITRRSGDATSGVVYLGVPTRPWSRAMLQRRSWLMGKGVGQTSLACDEPVPKGV